MNVKTLLVQVFVAVIVVSFATESEAYMDRGGMTGKIQSKREYKVSFKNNYLFFFLGVSSKFSFGERLVFVYFIIISGANNIL